MKQPTTEPTNTTIIETLKAGWESWPAPVVARTEIESFTGGLICARSLANYDSLGKGPGGRIKLGRSVGYLKSDLISWLLNRLEG
ncbi:MAG: hypothetical protein DRH50_12155 [Deltaproteobacteria bacterium]|nr:MAG: hypothetical protein DRH50_12155 [Deltaproteobacteria bacterium]